MIILCTEWRTARDTIGILLCKNEMGQVKCYIGSGDGFDEEVDKNNIADYGAKLQMKEAIAFFPDWENEIKENWFDLDKW